MALREAEAFGELGLGEARAVGAQDDRAFAFGEVVDGQRQRDAFCEGDAERRVGEEVDALGAVRCVGCSADCIPDPLPVS